MTEQDLIEIVADLKACVDMLARSGEAYRDGNEEEMFANMAAMAPRLERATNVLDSFLTSRRESENINVAEMDGALEDHEMVWGHTRTEEKSDFVADGVCIALREECDKEFLRQIDNARKGVDSTEQGLHKIWDKIIEEPRYVLNWSHIEDDRAVFTYGSGDNVSVQINRLAAMRALTLFERAEFSPNHPKSVVFCRSTGEPIAAMQVYE